MGGIEGEAPSTRPERSEDERWRASFDDRTHKIALKIESCIIFKERGIIKLELESSHEILMRICQRR
ncbi:MAG: hypothetical protein A2Z91_04850 [Deltaproteobacteria bacterium GWA2_38_16]|nr:MAG: hypothetical protein A2Z91_04850 [Deltaproteobacteria bacterium GWA2_38_16]